MKAGHASWSAPSFSPEPISRRLPSAIVTQPSSPNAAKGVIDLPVSQSHSTGRLGRGINAILVLPFLLVVGALVFLLLLPIGVYFAVTGIRDARRLHRRLRKANRLLTWPAARDKVLT